MLLEFRASNFRSIREEITFSMVASMTSRRRDGQLTHRTNIASIPKALPVAILLGPNGSGKSNFIRAVAFLRDFVVNSAKSGQSGQDIEVAPYRFSKETINKPSTFEISFIYDAVKYEYGFSANMERVIDEYLFSRQAGKNRRNQCVFTREWKQGKSDYDWYVNSNVRGPKDVWIKSTRDNALFLSTANQLNSESLRPPFTWIDDYLRLLDAPTVPSLITSRMYHTDTYRKEILSFLNMFDLNLSHIEVREEDIDLAKTPDDFHPYFEAIIRKLKVTLKIPKVTVFHPMDGSNEMAALDLSDESTGTNALFSLSGPITDTLKSGYCLLIDELNTSLHPNALRHIVGLFQDPNVNKKTAQLIFTTHDTAVLSDKLVSPDQVWLLNWAEKAGGTRLTPLSDYEIKDEELLRRRYLSGRYGGVPLISHPAIEDYVSSFRGRRRRRVEG